MQARANGLSKAQSRTTTPVTIWFRLPNLIRNSPNTKTTSGLCTTIAVWKARYICHSLKVHHFITLLVITSWWIFPETFNKFLQQPAWAIPKTTSDWLVKKIQNREQNFIICNSYIYNWITSPHSCHPHLGTCFTVILVFVGPRQRAVPPNYAASCWLHPWALRWCGSAGYQVQTVRRVVKNLQLKSLIKAFVRDAVWGWALSCRRMMPLVSIPQFVLNWPPKLIQRFTINLWWYCGPWCHAFWSTKFPYGPRIL